MGLLLEVSASNVDKVCKIYSDNGVPCNVIGQSVGYGVDAMVCYGFRYTLLFKLSISNLDNVCMITGYHAMS